MDTILGDEFSFRAVSTFEIRKIVISFPSNKAPGADKVSMQVIKDALLCIPPHLNRNHQQISTYISLPVNLEGS
jgi:hypothetical protein